METICSNAIIKHNHWLRV